MSTNSDRFLAVCFFVIQKKKVDRGFRRIIGSSVKLVICLFEGVFVYLTWNIPEGLPLLSVVYRLSMARIVTTVVCFHHSPLSCAFGSIRCRWFRNGFEPGRIPDLLAFDTGYLTRRCLTPSEEVL